MTGSIYIFQNKQKQKSYIVQIKPNNMGWRFASFKIARLEWKRFHPSPKTNNTWIDTEKMQINFTTHFHIKSCKFVRAIYATWIVVVSTKMEKGNVSTFRELFVSQPTQTKLQCFNAGSGRLGEIAMAHKPHCSYAAIWARWTTGGAYTRVTFLPYCFQVLKTFQRPNLLQPPHKEEGRIQLCNCNDQTWMLLNKAMPYQQLSDSLIYFFRNKRSAYLFHPINTFTIYIPTAEFHVWMIIIDYCCLIENWYLE